MQYEVPQFIDVKDKVFGPLTVSQFIFSGGGVAGAYAAYRFIPSPVNILVAIAVLLFGLMLAFYEYNGRPFLVMLQAMISYTIKGKLFLWKFRDEIALSQGPSIESQKQKDEVLKNQNNIVVTQNEVEDKNVSRQKLQDIAWGLDVLDER